MSDSLEALMQTTPLTAQLFAPNSRYYGSETAIHTRADGTPVRYVRRRFCPPPERFALLLEHVVHEGERLDNITTQYLGDSELFWRVCDSNNVLRPEELEQVATQVRITLPEGVPGVG